MKKITIFAFIGFVFVAGMFFSSKAHASEVTLSGAQTISAEEARILKQALDILEVVLKDVEAKVSKNELSSEKKVVVDKSLSAIEGSLVHVDYLVKNYAGENYPGSGSLYVEEKEQSPIVVSESVSEEESLKEKGLASLWATIWPNKLVGIILLLAAVWILIANFKKKKQLAT